VYGVIILCALGIQFSLLYAALLFKVVCMATDSDNSENNSGGVAPEDATQGGFEHVVESSLWNARFAVFPAVVCGIIAAITMFVAGSFEVYHGVSDAFIHGFDDHGNKGLVMHVIGAIDLYLIGMVLLIFSFGLYELFISHIDVGRNNDEVKILEISSLDDLKTRVVKVIIMVLIVTFFKKIISMGDVFTTPLDMMYFAISIFAISFGVYFMHKSD
jgi:uncharacterized protein (TIGR00645 family)